MKGSTKTTIAVCIVLLIGFSGCATQQTGLRPDQTAAGQDDIETRIESLAGRLSAALRNSTGATANIAVIDEASVGKGEVSQLGTFITDRLKQHLTWKNFSVVDVKGVHWSRILNNAALDLPETPCDVKEYPHVILLVNVRDYGPNSSKLYVTVTAKASESNRYIEGLVIEEQFDRSGRVVSWLQDTKPFVLPSGTENKPFVSIDDGASYLAGAICCPYREFIRTAAHGDMGGTAIDPEDITVVIAAVNGVTRKAGRFERLFMQTLKNCMIKNCDISHAADFSDYGLMDMQLAFYEKEGTFKLDYTASNKERFKPATVLLIAETQYKETGTVNVLVRAVWLGDLDDTVTGERVRLGGTYVAGFASSAYFVWERTREEIEEEASGPIKDIALIVSGEPGAESLQQTISGRLMRSGYRVVGKNSRTRKLTLEVTITALRCFDEIDACYDFSLKGLAIRDRKGRVITTFADTAHYSGHSPFTDDKNEAVRGGILMLWKSMEQDVLQAVKSCSDG